MSGFSRTSHYAGIATSLRKPETIVVLSPLLVTTLLLACSNVFMTFAWYALQVPANRIGYTVMTLSKLKILQEVLSLIVFVPFLVLYMRQPIKLDYVWAALCIIGAVYFVFRT